MVEQFGKISLCTLLVMLMTGCYFGSASEVNTVGRVETTVWLAYWDTDAGSKDIKQLKGSVYNISYFAAYFDKDDNLFIPEEIIQKKEKLENLPGKTYLSFVNDKAQSDGTNILKDKDVLRRVFENDESMQNHIDKILSLTKQGKYDGVEIDYEALWKNTDLTQKFLVFTDKLYTQAETEGLKVRIVLEPQTPFAAGFCKGPEYVVMMYNLYGLHSGPGPKANREFIQSVLMKMQNLPGEKSVAFATGGCLWGSNGEKRLLTEDDAVALAKKQHAKLNRDKESGCQVFSYEKDGVTYTIWYADAETITYWTSAALELGDTNISLWRMGGNSDIGKIK